MALGTLMPRSAGWHEAGAAGAAAAVRAADRAEAGPAVRTTTATATVIARRTAGALSALHNLRAIVALGRIAHDSALRTFGLRLAQFPFAHGAVHDLRVGGVRLFDSYHCSRYNTNTRVLTPEMFGAVFASVRAHLAADAASSEV